MCVCICMLVYVCVYDYMHECAHAHASVYISTCMCVLHTCMCVRTPCLGQIGQFGYQNYKGVFEIIKITQSYNGNVFGKENGWH